MINPRQKAMIKKIIPLIIAAIVIFLAVQQDAGFSLSPPSPTTQNASSIGQAYANRQSDLQVSGEGVVVKVLPDDNKGSRHQRFILELDGGLTVLVAHNIDLTARVSGLSRGDTVAFNGEYEWNEKGGVIHWTHHDPAGRHVDGWLRHQGKTYQ